MKKLSEKNVLQLLNFPRCLTQPSEKRDRTSPAFKPLSQANTNPEAFANRWTQGFRINNNYGVVSYSVLAPDNYITCFSAERPPPTSDHLDFM